ncbi:hypothetical protein [Sporosarcina ureilytica]|uniref:hypothetical protein n=1 Tax=Sporosarcina ureilytica TaxID=298596 RepID=UPI0012DB51DE|nr:hypothetical protein [Sporosarcina ureilytica]
MIFIKKWILDTHNWVKPTFTVHAPRGNGLHIAICGQLFITVTVLVQDKKYYD